MKKLLVFVIALCLFAGAQEQKMGRGEGMGAGRPSQEQMEKMMASRAEEMFKAADKNADGVLSKEEFVASMKARKGMGQGGGMQMGNGQRGGGKRPSAPAMEE